VKEYLEIRHRRARRERRPHVVLSRLYQGSIKAPSRLHQGSIKALSRLYQGSIKALSRLYQGSSMETYGIDELEDRRLNVALDLIDIQNVLRP
jgi:hypothetical protein